MKRHALWTCRTKLDEEEQRRTLTTDPTPETHRPVMIMPLLLKLTHSLSLLRLKPAIAAFVRKLGFQHAFVDSKAIYRIVGKATSWVQRSKTNALLLIDLKGAYDAIPHARLLDLISLKMGTEWAAVFDALLSQ